MEETIEQLRKLAYDSWPGRLGDERAEKLESYLRAKLKEYSEKLDIPQEEILANWEAKRDYSATNYYQEANQPNINAESTRVFETLDDFKAAVNGQHFRCPMCEGVSRNPGACDSGLNMSKGKICNWNAGGLFGTLDRGVFVFIKDKMDGQSIFKPIAWEEKHHAERSV